MLGRRPIRRPLYLLTTCMCESKGQTPGMLCARMNLSASPRFSPVGYYLRSKEFFSFKLPSHKKFIYINVLINKLSALIFIY